MSQSRYILYEFKNQFLFETKVNVKRNIQINVNIKIQTQENIYGNFLEKLGGKVNT